MSRLERGGEEEDGASKERKTEVCWSPRSPAAGSLPDCC